MNRRTVLWSPLLLGAQRVWKTLANSLAPAKLALSDAPTQASAEEAAIVLGNSNHQLKFDRKNARLLSFKAKDAPDQEFIVSSEQVPVFVIQFLIGDREFQQISSTG